MREDRGITPKQRIRERKNENVHHWKPWDITIADEEILGDISQTSRSASEYAITIYCYGHVIAISIAVRESCYLILQAVFCLPLHSIIYVSADDNHRVMAIVTEECTNNTPSWTCHIIRICRKSMKVKTLFVLIYRIIIIRNIQLLHTLFILL